MTAEGPMLIPELLHLFKINLAFLNHSNLTYYVVIMREEDRQSNAEKSFFTHMHALFCLPVTHSVTLFIFLNLTQKNLQDIHRFNSDQSSVRITVFDDRTKDLENKLIQIINEYDPEIFYESSRINSLVAAGSNIEPLHFSVVDDDQIVRSFLKEFIERQDWNYPSDVETFREGQSFFESKRLEKAGKHVVLLESILPRITGLEIVKQIRKNYSDDTVSIMMFSGRKREDDALSAFKFGVNDFMEKPIRIHELALRIMNMTKRMRELVSSFN
ncbi:response regulator transcription factor [Sporolactobacillus spathodeae]|uniref:PleD family two-component response regulator n=1 Tax=Sporolactobacillus spathodeae TaxID=1465502 RepID=A0ABS2Q680_9BACL|nr:response regulator [Sporolactobacillus spathodeae]MBM7656825.1 PleD family two-component response regulator [Sporolactobacillus spathodeae]